MKNLRANNGHFEISAQEMAKMLDFQHHSNVEEYHDQKLPKKTIQDVIIRWWFVRCTLRQFRWLKKVM